MTVSALQRRIRQLVKRFIYSQLSLREGLYILLGWSRPLIQFTVEATPPSIYLNFALRSEVVPGIEERLGLPHPLAPVRCLEFEEPFHCLTLNVYRVSGLVNGLRAEWSTYIREPSSGKPRYLVLEACSDSGSMDPVAIVTRAGKVSHERSARGLISEVLSADGTRFRAVCKEPQKGEPVRSAPEWVEANDFIYWMNGICDRTFYDASLANARTSLLDPSQVEIEDATRWGRMVEPVPRSVVVFEDAISLVLSPWWNLDEIGRGAHG